MTLRVFSPPNKSKVIHNLKTICAEKAGRTNCLTPPSNGRGSLIRPRGLLIAQNGEENPGGQQNGAPAKGISWVTAQEPGAPV